MSRRLSFEESYRTLQSRHLIGPGDVPPLPAIMPRHDDSVHVVTFFRTMIADAKLEHFTLPHTFISRSEFRTSSFKDTDLSESLINWNDFIEVRFTGTDLSGSDMRGCVFNKARFRRAKLVRVDFRYCGFTACDFTEADLTDAKITIKVGKVLKLSPEQQSVIDWQTDDGEEPAGG